MFEGKGKKRVAAIKTLFIALKAEADYTKRDFTDKAAQNLETDESRGKSQTIKWEVINKSKGNFIKYIVYYEKN